LWACVEAQTSGTTIVGLCRGTDERENDCRPVSRHRRAGDRRMGERLWACVEAQTSGKTTVGLCRGID